MIAHAVRPEELTRAAAQGVDLAEIDAALVTVATTRPHDELVAVVRHYRRGAGPRRERARPHRGPAVLVHRHADGTRRPARASSTPSVGRSCRRAGVDHPGRPPEGRHCAPAPSSRPTPSSSSPTTPSPPGSLPVLRTVKPHVVVTVPLDDLLDAHDTPARRAPGSGRSCPPPAARWLACDATITRLVLDPDGLPLDVGRTKRVVPPHIRRAVEQRDHHCVFTGCYAPTWWCDVHHLLEWINGGETSLENSGLLCERHHTKVHHGYRINEIPTADWHTYRPDGTEIHILTTQRTPHRRTDSRAADAAGCVWTAQPPARAASRSPTSWCAPGRAGRGWRGRTRRRR